VEHGGVDVSLKDVQTAFLLGGTVTTGLMAGVFGLYAHTIMRGLTSTDDRTFVGAFQAMDRAIINPLFMLSFLGALVLDAGAAILSFRDDARSQLPWTIAAASLYFAVGVITFTVHLPLNDNIKAAGPPDRVADLAAVRASFHETRWIAWNIVRAIASTAAFCCLAWALVLNGRATGDAAGPGEHPPAESLAPPGSLPSEPRVFTPG
jgi:uncharacterized membrane protein